MNVHIEPSTLALAWVALLNVGIGIYVLRRNPGAPLNRAFAFLALAIALWTIGIALTYHTSLTTTATLRFAFAAVVVETGMSGRCRSSRARLPENAEMRMRD